MEHRKEYVTGKGYKMDLTKGLKLDYIRTGERTDVETGKVGDRQIIDFWYNRAKGEEDIDKKDEYANRALFKSKEVAFQEGTKYHQKERRSKTIFQDSFADFMIARKGQMGISMSTNTDFRGHHSPDDSDTGPNSVSASFSKFLPESYIEDHVNQSDMFDILVKCCGDDSDEDTVARKMMVAYYVFNSKYDRFLSVSQYKFFEKEFEYISLVAKQDMIHFTDLWVHQRLAKKIFGYYFTRFQLERCKADVVHFIKITTMDRVGK